MKHVFEHLEGKAASFSELPLFAYLRDTRIDARERLAFIPCVAPFVMTFADLYRFLVEEPPGDRYQELVNTHLAEEHGHWKWFLSDLTNLDLDPTLRFTDALRFVWSDRTIKSRMLAYEMCKLSAGKDSLSKLVLVQSIEATGQMGLAAAAPVGREVAARLGRKLVYFGAHHLDTERHHTFEEDAVRRSIEGVVLDSDRRAALNLIVDSVFRHFGDFADEVFSFAKSKSGFTAIAKEA